MQYPELFWMSHVIIRCKIFIDFLHIIFKEGDSILGTKEVQITSQGLSLSNS